MNVGRIVADDSPHGIAALGEAGIVDAAAALAPAATVSFLEGPAGDVDGSVYFSDIAANRLMRLDPQGRVSVFREDSGRANGNAFDLDGRLVTCEGGELGPGGRRRMTRTDVMSGEIDVLTDRFKGQRYNSPNDVVVDLLGRIFFTDPRYGDRSDLEMDVEAVYRIDLNGSVHRIISQPQIQRPNGLAVTADARELFVIDSHPQAGGNRKIWGFPLDDSGDPGTPRLVYDFGAARGGDGMELDQQGNLWVCAGLLTARGTGETTDVAPGVYVIRPDGELVGSIPVPNDTITNCCFAGPELRTLYVAAGPTLYRIDVQQPGYHAYPVDAGV